MTERGPAMTRQTTVSRHAFVARGFCGWCASPFMRPMGDDSADGTRCPVLYCKRTCKLRATSKRKQIAAHAHLCPTPHKRVFLSEPLALLGIADYTVPKGMTLRVYHCDRGCRGWHPTSKPNTPDLTPA